MGDGKGSATGAAHRAATIAGLERDVAAEQQAVDECRREVESLIEKHAVVRPATLNVAKGLDRSVSSGALLANPLTMPLDFIRVSASGHHVALAGGDEACLCEARSAGFRRVAKQKIVPGAPVVAMQFVKDGDEAQLILAADNVCIGWEPFAASDADELPMFMKIWAKSGRIIAVDSALGTGFPADELLLLATVPREEPSAEEAGCSARSDSILCGFIEIYDLTFCEKAAPRLLNIVKLDAVYFAGAALVCQGALVASLVVEVDLDSGYRGPLLLLHEVESAKCVLSAQLEDVIDRVKISRLALARCEDDDLIAVGIAGGLVQVVDAGNRDPCAAQADSSLAGTKIDEDSIGDRMALAWCPGVDIRVPLLAVGGRPDAVILYAYFELEGKLELLSMPQVPGANSLPRALAWASVTGELLAAFTEEWQFWILEEADLDCGSNNDGSTAIAGDKVEGISQNLLETLHREEEAAKEEEMRIPGDTDTRHNDGNDAFIELGLPLDAATLLFGSPEDDDILYGAEAACADEQVRSPPVHDRSHEMHASYWPHPMETAQQASLMYNVHGAMHL